MARRNFAGSFAQLLCWMFAGLCLLALLTAIAGWVVTVPVVQDTPGHLSWNGPHWGWMVLIYIGLTVGFWLFSKWVNRMEMEQGNSAPYYAGDGATLFPVTYDTGNDHADSGGGGDGGGDGGGGE